MSVAYLLDLWLCSLVRSALRCEVAFSSSFLQKEVLVSTPRDPHLDIKGAGNCCREAGYVTAVS
jgi:hypothetical protein